MSRIERLSYSGFVKRLREAAWFAVEDGKLVIAPADA
jgi:hypothetical protein